MFPINVSLLGRLVLMVGAGRVGRRKLEKLLRAGARVLVVEPRPDESVLNLARAGRVELKPDYQPELISGASLVFAATSDPALNRVVAEAARARGVWVNVADAPELSDFTLPAVVERGDFNIAVTTGGGSPALAASAATQLRNIFGPEYGLLAGIMARLRPKILASGLPLEAREKLFRKMADSEELRVHLARGETEEARNLIRRLAAPIEVGDDLFLFEDN